MSELPLIFFPRPTVQRRRTLGGGPDSYQRPSAVQQEQRLRAKFDEIIGAFEDFQTTVTGIEPEQVIVLETLTASVENLAKAASQIPGMEWLAERDLEEVAPDFGFQDGDDPTANIPRRLYALMSNQRGMQELISLWRSWTERPTQRARRNFGPFKKLFELLGDIRRWGDRKSVV